MREPEHVAACYAAMDKTVDIPVTIKCRIGIDDEDSFEFLDRFVGSIADKGCKTFIIHARSAWLKGLSPKENRDVPPLNYERVHEIKEKYPHLRVILNGGITDMTQIDDAKALDGVMIGREAYQNPYWLSEIERKMLGHHDILGRDNVARSMIPYINAQMERFGTPVKSITRHMMGLYHHQPGAKQWRRALSRLPYEDGADGSVIEKAIAEKDSAVKNHVEARKE